MQQSAVSRIVGVGHYFPSQIVRSDDLMMAFNSESRFGLPVRYLSSLVGIKERRWSEPGTKPSFLALEACTQALRMANISARQIDCVLYCGIERDVKGSSTAQRIQSELGSTRANFLDVTNACHGFMNGLSIADALIANKTAITCLVCTGEIGSSASRSILRQLQDPHCSKDDLKVLLGGLTAGDAGAAMILQASKDGSGFQRFKFESAGEYTHLCHYTRAANGEIRGEMHMEEICKETLAFHSRCIDETYEALGWSPRDVATLFSHQVGTRVHRNVCRMTGIDSERAPMTIQRYGNIASATIPVLFSLNPPSKGDKVIIISSGSGMTIGQSAFAA